jgi:hypothetical protein
VPAAAIAAYYLLYARAWRGDAAKSKATGNGPALVVAFVLLAFISLVYSSVFSLAETPKALAAAWSADPSGLVVNPEWGRWLPRWLHMVAGALALGAFALAVFARDDGRLFPAARRICLGSLIAAILLGAGALAGLAGGLGPWMRSAAPWWTLGSLLLALGALHLLFRRKLLAAGALFSVSLFAMVVQRHVGRLVALDGVLDPATLPVRPQWDVFALFLLCFVAMLGVSAWMLRTFFAARAPEKR